MRSQAVQEAAQRIQWVRTGLLLAFSILGLRATYLTLADDRGESLGDRQLTSRIPLAAARGGIFDRSDRALAVSISAPSIYVSPTELEDPSRALVELARALGVDRRSLAARLAGRRRFTYVARWVSAEAAERVEALELPGVGTVREPRRIFPAGPLAGSILGFANIDGVGVRGVEQQEDGWLRGKEMRLPVERDARGRLLSSITLNPQDAAGGDVALTIDAAMQAEAEAALARAVEKSGALGGFVISLDPRTGELLAVAEAPGFDPNLFRQVDYQETRSRVYLDALEPGSTFKVFAAAAALETGAVDESTIFDCTGGTYRVRGKTIRDHEDYGEVNLARMIQVSSNCGAVQVAERVGPELHYDTLKRFGFGARTGSGFPFESAGLLRPWNEWKPVDQATVAYGQGVSVTPIQLAAAIGALANDGVWLPPRLVRARRAPGADWEAAPAPEGRRVLSPETVEIVMRMMEDVVSTEGTARRAGLRGLRVAGKTGTAQKFDAEERRYSRTRYTAWFMGAVPAEDPVLVVVAALDEPQGWAHTGGDVAAPLFARVAADQLAQLGIATEPKPLPRKQTETQVAEAAPADLPNVAAGPQPVATRGEAGDSPRQAALPSEMVRLATSSADTPSRVLYRPTGLASSSAAVAAASALVPEFRGSTISEAKNLASEYILEVELLGRGLAVSQDPPAGTILTDGHRRVRILFSASVGEG